MIGSRYRYHRNGPVQTTAISPDELLSMFGDQLMDRGPQATLHDALRRGIADQLDAHLPGIDQVRDALRDQMTEQAIKASRIMHNESHSSAENALSQATSRLLRALQKTPERTSTMLGQIDLADLDLLIQSLSSSTAAAPLQRLREYAELDRTLRQATSITDVQAIPDDAIAGTVGDELSSRFNALLQSIQAFETSGYTRQGSDRLSSHALRRLGDLLLTEALRNNRSLVGSHISHRNQGIERGDTSRAYRFGDPFDLDIRETLLTASRRSAGIPVQLRASDLAVFERDPSQRVATVLAIDRSRSMGERGYLRPARQVAMTLASLIRNRFRRDRLQIIGFSNEASEIQVNDLDQLSWDRHNVGTNIQDALNTGRRILETCVGYERRLILITDGEPTAWRDQTGEPRYVEPVSDDALIATYAAGRRCRRASIDVTVALLTIREQTVTFAKRLARETGGRLTALDADELFRAVLGSFGSR